MVITLVGKNDRPLPLPVQGAQQSDPIGGDKTHWLCHDHGESSGRESRRGSAPGGNSSLPGAATGEERQKDEREQAKRSLIRLEVARAKILVQSILLSASGTNQMIYLFL